jgi:hypothetical protein
LSAFDPKQEALIVSPGHGAIEKNEPKFDVVCEGNHADGLPDAKSYARCDAAVQAPDAIFFIDERQGVHDRQFGWSIDISRLFSHGLHLADTTPLGIP